MNEKLKQVINGALPEETGKNRFYQTKKILLGIKKRHFCLGKRTRISNEDSLAKIQSKVRRRAWKVGYNTAMNEFNGRVDDAIKKISKLRLKPIDKNKQLFYMGVPIIENSLLKEGGCYFVPAIVLKKLYEELSGKEYKEYKNK